MGNFLNTIYHLKKDGPLKTGCAVLERFQKEVPYVYPGVSEEEKEYQREVSRRFSPVLVSILVPVYETEEAYLRAMIGSCLEQTYERLELILADASESTRPQEVITSYDDPRIRYIKLRENAGIAGNTVAAMKEARGDYMLLLDHDDLLTADALYELVREAVSTAKEGQSPVLVYADEDHTDAEGTGFFNPNRKPGADLDLLLGNNYICHPAMVRSDVLNRIGLSSRYDGAQDYELYLKIFGEVLFEDGRYRPEYCNKIRHVQKVLYHWRQHEGSTSLNPAGKGYAYEAGRRAVEDFVEEHFEKCPVTELFHRGYYRVEWGARLWEIRPEVGAAGGLVYKNGKAISGIYRSDRSKKDKYLNLNRLFSGYMHRADLVRRAYALDIRTVTPAPEFEALREELLDEARADGSEEAYRKASLTFAEQLHKSGRILLYDRKCSIFQ